MPNPPGRPRSLDPKNSVHVRFPIWMLERIDSIARGRRIPRSRVVIDAVKRQLELKEANVFDDLEKQP